MPNETEERQPAQGREQAAKELFPYWSMTPEEYAARNGADWMCFSFHQYRYQDEQLDAWLQRLGVIFFTNGLLDQCRREILTPEEYRLAQEREAEPF